VYINWIHLYLFTLGSFLLTCTFCFGY